MRDVHVGVRVSAQSPDVAAADPEYGDATAVVALLATLPAGMRAAVPQYARPRDGHGVI